MDYNLDALGTRQFEHLVQALCVKTLGARVSVFGDGPDGGREATWEGDTPSLGVEERWQGYGVLQAKMRQYPLDVADNLKWLKKELTSELSKWQSSEGRSKNLPNYFVLATNVRLSAAKGKDSIKEALGELNDQLSLGLRDFRVWDYDDIKALLDDSPGIRRTYAAFITPGDVMTTLLAEAEQRSMDIAHALHHHAARTFRNEMYLNLTQAGSVRDQKVTVADVFVDLPYSDSMPGNDASEQNDIDLFPLDSDSDSEELILSHLISRFDTVATESASDSKKEESLKKIVLIGGPGQGKSTVTQFLAQMYRAEFLTGSAVAGEAELSADLKSLRTRSGALGIAYPRARRWPIRIILSELADSLARGEASSILGYIAHAVSDRSAVEISATDMRNWLSQYPWLLIIDGLDEVPNSSNRHDVMRALGDFSLEAAAVGANDIAMVATTRPQGYSDEFNPEVFLHLNLSSLSIDKALEYAKGFIAVRLGASSPGADRTLERLRRASRDSTTARLFSSPLQVSILSILVEKLGQVPRDRWRLFSQYYRVISQRELEKGGELSELLQSYEHDVDFLHRQIGDLLQRRSAEAGENSATISHDEFLDLISERLRQQGHAEVEILRLSSEFSRLVTDRLVFLALINSTRIGFEIRSLQEFMAGEYVVSLPESKVIDALRPRAIDPFWRNVVLFAIGCVFAEREHLKGGVVSLCAELDLLDETSRLLRPGGRLALDVLMDGSCQSQPRYSKPLAERAALLLEGPIQHSVRDLAEMTDGPAGQLIVERITSTAPASLNIWINRAVALAELCAAEASYQDALNELYRSAPPSAQAELFSLALDMESIHLDTAAMLISQHIDIVNMIPGRYSPALATTRRFSRRTKEERTGPPLMLALRTLFGRVFFDDIEVGSFGDDGTLLNMGLISIDRHAEAWRAIKSNQIVSEGSDILNSLANFAISPSEEALGDVLLRLASDPALGRRFTRAAPWVVAACAEAAESIEELQLGSGSDHLRKLSELAQEGILGNYESWTAAEKRWMDLTSEQANDTFLHLAEMPQRGSLSLPIWPELSQAGLPLFGMAVTMRRPSDRIHRDALIDLLITWLRNSRTEIGADGAAAILQLSAFVACLLLKYPIRDDEDLRVGAADAIDALFTSEQWGELLQLLTDRSSVLLQHQLAWLDWVLVAKRANVDIDVTSLVKMGSHSRIKVVDEYPFTDVSWITAAPIQSKPTWQQIRLRLHFDISYIRDLDVNVVLAEPDIAGPQAMKSVAALAEIMNSTVGEIEAGSLDGQFTCLFKSDSDSVDLEMLDRALGLLDPEEDADLLRQCAIATRAIVLLNRKNPWLVHFLQSRINKNAPILWRTRIGS